MLLENRIDSFLLALPEQGRKSQRDARKDVLSDDGWRVFHCEDRHLNHPWQIAHVWLVHRSIPNIPYSYSGWNPWQILSGEGCLKEQIISLTLFPVETGFLMRPYIVILGPRLGKQRNGVDVSRVYGDFQTWEFGLEGYTTLEKSLSPTGPWSVLLQRVDGENSHETVARIDRDYSSEPIGRFYF